jgi:glycosyltransferase involved in cell wall biosynthesis
VSFIRKDVSELKITLFKQIERIANAFNGIVVACGPSEGERFLEIGIKPQVISNGTVIKAVPEKVGKHSVFTVVTCGRFTEAKDPAKFNEIALRLQEHQDIRFLWIGDGDLRHFITSSNVEITGWVGKEELDELILKSQLYLSTSLWEGLPVSVLEAMVNGLPLLLSRVNGNVDLVQDGLNGYSFNTVDEAVNRVLDYKNSIELCINHGMAGRAIAEHDFSLEQTIEKYYQLYRRLSNNER